MQDNDEDTRQSDQERSRSRSRTRSRSRSHSSAARKPTTTRAGSRSETSTSTMQRSHSMASGSGSSSSSTLGSSSSQQAFRPIPNPNHPAQSQSQREVIAPKPSHLGNGMIGADSVRRLEDSIGSNEKAMNDHAVCGGQGGRQGTARRRTSSTGATGEDRFSSSDLKLDSNTNTQTNTASNGRDERALPSRSPNQDPMNLGPRKGSQEPLSSRASLPAATSTPASTFHPSGTRQQQQQRLQSQSQMTTFSDNIKGGGGAVPRSPAEAKLRSLASSSSSILTANGTNSKEGGNKSSPSPSSSIRTPSMASSAKGMVKRAVVGRCLQGSPLSGSVIRGVNSRSIRGTRAAKDDMIDFVGLLSRAEERETLIEEKVSRWKYENRFPKRSLASTLGKEKLKADFRIRFGLREFSFCAGSRTS